jgi:hypothetical protein
MCAPVRECPSRFRDFGAALSDARSLHGPLLSPCSLPRRWVHLISPRASHSHSSLTSQGTRPQSPLHPAVGQPLRWVLVAGRPYPDRPILLVRVPRLFHAASLESLEAATAARPTFPRRCGVYRLRARHVAIGAPGSDGNKLTVVGVGWRLAHAREHLRLVAATELGMVAIDKWLVSSALWVGSALQLLWACAGCLLQPSLRCALLSPLDRALPSLHGSVWCACGTAIQRLAALRALALPPSPRSLIGMPACGACWRSPCLPGA